MHRFQKHLLSACLAAWAACGASAFAQDPAPPPEAEAGTKAGAPDRAARLDALYAELAEPGRADADRVEADIQRLWGQSGSAAMDLLLRRAQDAIAAQDLNAALDHLDAAIDHDPGFAEAWNLRGSVFYLLDEYALAMNDIEHVLALEPRHFGAMEGLAIIFVETDHPDLALRVVERARAVNPNRESLKETEERLERELGASDL
jgi:tetratricopeptide (TPR) repeat protein